MSKKQKRNNHVHVCLISDQSIANLAPLLLELPVRAILLTTAQKEEQAEWLENVLRPKGIKVERRTIPPFDFNSVIDVCEDVIKHVGDDDITLNVTGGTKVVALAAFETFYSAGKRIIYLNTDSDELLELSRGGSKPVPNVLNVKTYLQSCGLEIRQDPRARPMSEAIQRQVCTQELAGLLIENPDMISYLNRTTAPFNDRMAEHKYINMRPVDVPGPAAVLFDLLTCNGLVTPGLGNSININTVAACRYLSGGWIEEYVFHSVRNLKKRGLDVLINVEVDWATPGKDKTRNEFDVLFTWRNRLHIISCKTAAIDKPQSPSIKGKEALYELDSLADKAGGIFGKAMLLSARPLSETSRLRAARMGIKVVDGRSILRLQDVLLSWIS